MRELCAVCESHVEQAPGECMLLLSALMIELTAVGRDATRRVSTRGWARAIWMFRTKLCTKHGQGGGLLRSRVEFCRFLFAAPALASTFRLCTDRCAFKDATRTQDGCCIKLPGDTSCQTCTAACFFSVLFSESCIKRHAHSTRPGTRLKYARGKQAPPLPRILSSSRIFFRERTYFFAFACAGTLETVVHG